MKKTTLAILTTFLIVGSLETRSLAETLADSQAKTQATSQANPQTQTKSETTMTNTPFDFRTYGHIEQNEIQVGLLLKKEGTQISAALQFKNVAQREVHVTHRIWFQNLKLTLQDKPLPYQGPMVSMAAPTIKDFTTVKPGETYTTETVSLNDYFGLPENATGMLKASYTFRGAPVAPAQAELNL